MNFPPLWLLPRKRNIEVKMVTIEKKVKLRDNKEILNYNDLFKRKDDKG